MKRKLSFIAFVLLSLGCMAAPVGTDVSRRAAANFWNTYRPADVKAIDAEQMHLMPVASLPMLNIWAVGEEGFVVDGGGFVGYRGECYFSCFHAWFVVKGIVVGEAAAGGVVDGGSGAGD